MVPRRFTGIMKRQNGPVGLICILNGGRWNSRLVDDEGTRKISIDFTNGK